MTRRWWSGAALVLAFSLSSNGWAAGPAPLSNADAALAELIKDLADPTQTVGQRIEIARVLADWPGPKVREPLLAALKDPSGELRAASAAALGWPGNREAIAALRERVEAPEEATIVKAAAVEALGIIGDPATRPLVVAATRHPEAPVRQAAVRAVLLGPLTDPADRIPYLIQLAEDRAFQGLFRCDAIRELYDVKEERVVDAFIRILETEPRFAISLPEGGYSQQQIMEIRRVQARDVAAWAAQGLGHFKADRALALLLKTAEDRSDYFLRLMSLRSLIALGAPETRAVFIRRLEDSVPDVRRLALTGLAQLSDRTAVGAVMVRLTDGNALVRAQAATTLAMLGDPAVRPALEELQKRETDSNVLYAVDEALARLPR